MRRSRSRVPAGVGLDDVLVAHDVSASYSRKEVLHSVDLRVGAGEVVVIVGPNGAGKSTLLGALAGDVAPTGGTVVLDGVPISSWSPRELAMRRAVLLQRVSCAFSFDVAEIVRMGRAAWRGTIEQIHDDAAIDRAIRDSGIAAFLDRPYAALSGGEQARVALARVLAQETAVLLLDEPTAAFDVRHQEGLLAVARRRAHASGVAVVIVMHDLATAAAHADRIVVLAHGEVRADGPPSELTSELLSDVWEHPIDVIRHPRTEELVIVPDRRRTP